MNWHITDDGSKLVIEEEDRDVLIEGLGVTHHSPEDAGNLLTVNRMLVSYWKKDAHIFETVNAHHAFPDCRWIGCGCARRHGVEEQAFASMRGS